MSTQVSYQSYIHLLPILPWLWLVDDTALTLTVNLCCGFSTASCSSRNMVSNMEKKHTSLYNCYLVDQNLLLLRTSAINTRLQNIENVWFIGLLFNAIQWNYEVSYMSHIYFIVWKKDRISVDLSFSFCSHHITGFWHDAALVPLTDWLTAEWVFTCVCSLSAHDDAIWTAAWGKSEADGSETIVTGSLDDMVKVWKWWVVVFFPSNL